MSDSDESKEFEASQKKLDEAKEKGDSPNSSDLVAATALMVSVSLFYYYGGATTLSFATALADFIGKADLYSFGIDSTNHGSQILRTLTQLAFPMLVWFGAPALSTIAIITALRTTTISTKRLAPDLSRIGPMQGFKRRFGPNGLIEFLKSLAKIGIMGVAAFVAVRGMAAQIIFGLELEPITATLNTFAVLNRVLIVCALAALALGIGDYLLNIYRHRKKLMMSRKELQDEAKESEGDPGLKQRRWQRGYEIATSKMIQAVPTADVIIVNPEHYAVALKWSKKPGTAPICVAKGTDTVAAKIRELAREANVPIHRDPPTARTIYAKVRIGSEVLPETYRAVAAAIRFAEAIRQKKPR
jgi:flagellar biosynthesis protein FlhB